MILLQISERPPAHVGKIAWPGPTPIPQLRKRLLIIGGTGTFGNTVLRRFLQTEIGEIRIFSRDEKKQDEMRNALRNPKVKFYLESVHKVKVCHHRA
jgi:FlaA1/EpsC-like NDP-sugar epimerase